MRKHLCKMYLTFPHQNAQLKMTQHLTTTCLAHVHIAPFPGVIQMQINLTNIAELGHVTTRTATQGCQFSYFSDCFSNKSFLWWSWYLLKILILPPGKETCVQTANVCKPTFHWVIHIHICPQGLLVKFAVKLNMKQRE